jgi:hypothetical protein
MQKGLSKLFKEKGFLNTEVNIVQRDDPEKKTLSSSTSMLEKGKVKIRELDFMVSKK